jgi:DNA-binding NarL/FixJ family response regulator
MPNLSIQAAPTPPRLEVLVAEGLPLVRALLCDLLTAQPGVTLVAEVTVVGELLAHTRRLVPDLVLLDWALGGLDVVQALRALDPAPAVIVLLAGADPEYSVAVLAHGGAACLPREHLHRGLPPALMQVMVACGKGVLHAGP